MGQEIVYCFKCSTRIVGADFEKGTAFQFKDRACCAGCASELLTTLPPPEREILLARMAKTGAPSKPKRPGRDSTTANPRADSSPPPRNPILVWGLVAGGLVAGGLLVLTFSGDGRKPTEESRSLPRSGGPELTDAEKNADAAIRRARDAAKAGADLDIVSRLWEEAVWASEKTSRVQEAMKERAGVLARRKEAYQQELARMEESVAGTVRNEEFRKTLDFLASARKRHDVPDWTMPIDRRIEQVNASVRDLYASLETKALDARRRDAATDVKEIQDRVGKWGLEESRAALQKALDGVAVSPLGPFLQHNDVEALITIEAEHFHRKVGFEKYAWTQVDTPGSEGGAAMVVLPNDGFCAMKEYVTKSPRLDYKINFAKAGTHYLWIRAWCGSEADNSVHAALDEIEIPTVAYISFSAAKKWVWSNKQHDGKVATFTVPSPGLRTFHLACREDGTIIDRFVITANSKFSPKGGGPLENPH